MPTSRTVTAPATMRQLTLGEFIHFMENVSNPAKRVVFDFGDVPRGETQLFDPYYTHPAEIAMQHRRLASDPRMTSAGTIVELSEQAVGCTFFDDSGVERAMQRTTPLWVANWAQSTGNAVVSVEETPGAVIIRTWRME